ncbi:MAG: hypothetical protein KGD65_04770 [Candidatus Lokiarchaeota archaeon]|nr:hypothetical protein [Candidatus Lokiarchaeota archaeon]
MEKSKAFSLEKPSLLSESNLKPNRKKEKMVDKIEDLWSNNNSNGKNSKFETKKLVVKLETSGKDRRKISLKLESNSSNIHSSNYNLLSELLREFFKVENNQN